MNKTFKKFLAILTTLTMAMSLFVVAPAMAAGGSAQGGGGVTSLNQNFENAEASAIPEGWSVVKGNSTIIVGTEGEGAELNNFMRITKGSTTSTVRTDLGENKLGLYGNGRKVAIEAKLRFSDVSAGKVYLKLNQEEEDKKEKKAGSDYIFVKAELSSNKFYVLDGDYNRNDGSIYQPTFNKYYAHTFEANTWYTVKYVIDPDTSTADLYLNGTEVISNASLTWWDFQGMSSLNSVSFELDSVVEGSNVDVDDVKICYEPNLAPTATITTGGQYSGRISDDADAFVIKFSCPVDPATLTTSTVVAKNNNGVKVADNEDRRFYDEENLQYHIFLTEAEQKALQDAPYAWTITLDGVYAENDAENYESGKMAKKTFYVQGATSAGDNYSISNIQYNGKTNAFLKDLTFNGYGVKGFDSRKFVYEVEFPYVYTEGAFTLPNPEVVAVAEDSEAKVEVDYSKWQNNNRGSIIVKVTSSDGKIAKKYTLKVKVVGENFLEASKLDGTNGGALQNWLYVANGTVNYSTADFYAGTASALVSSGTVNNAGFSTHATYHAIAGKAGRKYIFSAMSKLNPTNEDTAAIISYYINNTKTDVNINSGDWTRGYTTFATESNVNLQAKVYAALSETLENKTPAYYVDELYLGELLMKSLTINPSQTTVTVPENENVEIALNPVVLNQFGTINGLEAEQSVDSIVGNPNGTYLEDNKLVITPDAISGTYAIDVIKGAIAENASQTEIGRRITITINPNNTVRCSFVNEKIVNGENVIPKIYIGNNTNAEKIVRVYSALYKKVGENYKLENAVHKDYSAEPNSTFAKNLDPISVPNTQDVYLVKCFTWNTDNALKPLNPAAELD